MLGPQPARTTATNSRGAVFKDILSFFRFLLEASNNISQVAPVTSSRGGNFAPERDQLR